MEACDAGTNDDAHQQATLARVNYYRAMSGLPGNSELSPEWNRLCMEAALVVSRNDEASHNPSPASACYSADGAEAASKSLLYLGREGTAAIDGYIDDPGPENYFAGHRRWILYPPQKVLGTGSIPQHLSFRAANSLWVIGREGPRPAEPQWIAWPPAGFVPYQVMPRRSGRWSFSYPLADFSQAQVTVSHKGNPLPVELEPLENDHGYADNALVWIPNGIPLTAPIDDLVYEVTISGVVIGKEPKTFRYTVTIIDPSRVPDVLPPGVVIQPMDQTVRARAAAKFEVQASGTETLSFQWRFNNAIINGATNASLAILSVMPEHAGTYDVVVTNIAGSVKSAPARLSVLADGLLQWRREGANALMLYWQGEGILQQAEAPPGPWVDIPEAASPFTVPPQSARSFFRLRAP